jgi:hypothetical protein
MKSYCFSPSLSGIVQEKAGIWSLCLFNPVRMLHSRDFKSKSNAPSLLPSQFRRYSNRHARLDCLQNIDMLSPLCLHNIVLSHSVVRSSSSCGHFLRSSGVGSVRFGSVRFSSVRFGFEVWYIDSMVEAGFRVAHCLMKLRDACARASCVRDG